MENINSEAISKGINALLNNSALVAGRRPGIWLWHSLITFFDRERAAKSVEYPAEFLLDGKCVAGRVEIGRDGTIRKYLISA